MWNLVSQGRPVERCQKLGTCSVKVGAKRWHIVPSGSKQVSVAAQPLQDSCVISHPATIADVPTDMSLRVVSCAMSRKVD